MDSSGRYFTIELRITREKRMDSNQIFPSPSNPQVSKELLQLPSTTAIVVIIPNKEAIAAASPFFIPTIPTPNQIPVTAIPVPSSISSNEMNYFVTFPKIYIKASMRYAKTKTSAIISIDDLKKLFILILLVTFRLIILTYLHIGNGTLCNGRSRE